MLAGDRDPIDGAAQRRGVRRHRGRQRRRLRRRDGRYRHKHHGSAGLAAEEREGRARILHGGDDERRQGRPQRRFERRPERARDVEEVRDRSPKPGDRGRVRAPRQQDLASPALVPAVLGPRLL